MTKLMLSDIHNDISELESEIGKNKTLDSYITYIVNIIKKNIFLQLSQNSGFGVNQIKNPNQNLEITENTILSILECIELEYEYERIILNFSNLPMKKSEIELFFHIINEIRIKGYVYNDDFDKLEKNHYISKIFSPENFGKSIYNVMIEILLSENVDINKNPISKRSLDIEIFLHRIKTKIGKYLLKTKENRFYIEEDYKVIH